MSAPENLTSLRYTLIRLAVGDDVLIAVRDLEPGSHRTSAGTWIEVGERVSLGHKVAARDIDAGEQVTRFGMAIGSATTRIPTGRWVHTHNLVSNYIETFAERGAR